MKRNLPLKKMSTVMIICASLAVRAQAPDDFGPGPGDFPPDGGPGFGGPPPFGRGGPGGMMQQETKVVKQFDANGDGWLNAEERKAARAFLSTNGMQRGPGGGRRGGFGSRGRGASEQPAQPGQKLSPADVKSFPGVALYDPLTLRTFFLEFENADWEKELADFKSTDVDVPAKLTVDGKIYPDVGVHFHGMSSYMMVGEGQKRSLVLSLDFIHKEQQLEGYRTLNLLNSHEDPTFLHSVLSLQIARDYLPAPKANFARVVINGESWGIYANQQHFNKDFLREAFGTTNGARWKVPGSPNGRGSLAYLGEDASAYKRIYEIKSKDNAKSWADFIKLCRVLNETPAEKLEQAIAPLLDIDGALRFLAWENALVNGDGYWTRSSDYDIYEDEHGCFHIVPYDANETFSSGGGPGGSGGRRGRRMGPPGGNFGGGTNGLGGREFAGGPPEGFGRRGFGGGPQGGGVKLDPLVSANDTERPLASKLLSVPALRARYLGYVRDIATKWLDWNKLGPVAQQYHSLIADDVKNDTRKLESTEAFMSSLSTEGQPQASFGGPGGMSLKNFAEQRRAYLLNYSETKPPGN